MEKMEFYGSGNQDLKKELLEHYNKSEPKEFIQLDAFDVGPNYNDGIGFIVSGPEGIALTGGGTVELMKSDVDVRALINPQASQETVLKSLDELRDWVKRDWDIISRMRHSFICKQVMTKIPSNEIDATDETQNDMDFSSVWDRLIDAQDRLVRLESLPTNRRELFNMG
jgi:hypothetical protein